MQEGWEGILWHLSHLCLVTELAFTRGAQRGRKQYLQMVFKPQGARVLEAPALPLTHSPAVSCLPRHQSCSRQADKDIDWSEEETVNSLDKLSLLHLGVQSLNPSVYLLCENSLDLPLQPPSVFVLPYSFPFYPSISSIRINPKPRHNEACPSTPVLPGGWLTPVAWDAPP